MIPFIDLFIDRTSMYRLVLLYCAVLLFAATGLAMAGLLPFDPAHLVFSTAVITLSCAATNWLFARVFNVPANADSALITALVLALILSPVPPSDFIGLGALAMASIWAIASKFLIAIYGKHIFNPAALGVALAALLLDAPGTWWVANPYLLPLVIAGGLLISRKLHRTGTLLILVLANLATTMVLVKPADWQFSITETLLHSPLLFMGFAMLTEPLTAPSGRWWRIVYAVLIGVLNAPSLKFGDMFVTPELALLAGNLLAFVVNPKARLDLTLLRVEEIARDAADFVFSTNRPLRFAAGQYLEWTIPSRGHDARGNRRSFTIASAPSDSELRLGVKFYAKPSSFKQALLAMQPGDRMVAGHLAGSFVPPRSKKAKLALIAGGIGVTPFRSMIGEWMAKGESPDAVLLYGNATPDDIAYRPLLDSARERIGLKTVFAVEREAQSGMHAGFIDADLIRREIPDYRSRLFYLSGPQKMVAHFRRLLRRMGVPPWRIRTDYFPGFA